MQQQQSLPKPTRSLSIGQMVVIGLGLLLVAFLIIGTINDATAPDQPAFGLQAQSFLILAFLAFGGGLLSFASPCTLPILPAYFAFAFQSGRRQIALNTIAFMVGLATMFSLLGAGASAIGRVLLQNQQLILLIGGTLILGFGVMSLLGMGFTGMTKQEDSVQQRRGLGGSFLFGLTFAVGWSSCVGPILGAVLTLAAQTGSVLRGMILLFIYALGLGLPLIIVSTFFGRASRKSLFWRILRGKGWELNTHALVVALLWAFVVWRIIAAFVQYGFSTLTFTAVHSIGILLLTIAGAVLWVFTSNDSRNVTLQLHSTQAISGILFVMMGVLMLSGQLASFNSLIPPDLAIWFIDLEDQLIQLFQS